MQKMNPTISCGGAMTFLGRCHKGFTLIELMIVVAVIAILAAIAIPSYVGIQKKAARSEAKANLEAIALALEGYMAENNDYGPAGTNYWYICGDTCAKSSFGHLAPLATIANLGGGYGYNYQLKIIETPIPAYTVIGRPVRGYVAGDNGRTEPSVDSSGTKLPVGFW